MLSAKVWQANSDDTTSILSSVVGQNTQRMSHSISSERTRHLNCLTSHVTLTATATGQGQQVHLVSHNLESVEMPPVMNVLIPRTRELNYASLRLIKTTTHTTNCWLNSGLAVPNPNLSVIRKTCIKVSYFNKVRCTGDKLFTLIPG